jgi:hypothetical protein
VPVRSEEGKLEHMIAVGLASTLGEILKQSSPVLEEDSKAALEKLIESISSTGEVDDEKKEEIEKTLVELEWEDHLLPYPPKEAHRLIDEALGILHRA